jgi:hypothetical protein
MMRSSAFSRRSFTIEEDSKLIELVLRMDSAHD